MRRLHKCLPRGQSCSGATSDIRRSRRSAPGAGIGCGQCVMMCPSCADELSFMKDAQTVRAAELKLPSEDEALNLIMSRRSVRMFKGRDDIARDL